MELIIAPPKIALHFRVSLVHDLLTIVGLIHNANRFEGLSDWIRQIVHQINSHDRSMLYPINVLLIFATGIQGYLVASFEETSQANISFEALITAIQDQNPYHFQAAVFEAIQHHMIYLGVLETHDILPITANELEQVLNRAQHVREERWQSPPPPMSINAFTSLVMDAHALHQSVITGLTYVWEWLYKARAAIDLEQERHAAHYYLAQQYTSEFSNIFRAVTGRQLPEHIRDLIPQAQCIEMIPSSHLGIYVTTSAYANTLYIGFNANVAPTTPHVTHHLPIAELYPVMQALADETRLKMVNILAQGEQNVGEIAETLHLTQSTASRHLSLLAKTDILSVRRDGAMRYYMLNPTKLVEIGRMLQHFGTPL